MLFSIPLAGGFDPWDIAGFDVLLVELAVLLPSARVVGSDPLAVNPHLEAVDPASEELAVLGCWLGRLRIVRR